MNDSEGSYFPWDRDAQNHPGSVYEEEYEAHITVRLEKQLGQNWVGVVVLPPSHPDYEQAPSVVQKQQIKVHGGMMAGERRGEFVFDTAHEILGDVVPMVARCALGYELRGGHETLRKLPLAKMGVAPHYWTFEETLAETRRMAAQFAARCPSGGAK